MNFIKNNFEKIITAMNIVIMVIGIAQMALGSIIYISEKISAKKR